MQLTDEQYEQSKMCIVCGNTYSRTPHSGNLRWAQRKYCSHECYHKRPPNNKVQKHCESCDKSFFVRTNRKTSARFCSIRCWTTSDESKNIVRKLATKQRQENPYIGDNNPNWKGGLVSEDRLRLTRMRWKNIRRRLLRIYRNTCANCGNHKNLLVHHILSWRYGGQDKTPNLMVLCTHCHATVAKIQEDVFLAEAIKQKCIQCKKAKLQHCQIVTCPLHPYRPYRPSQTPQDVLK